VSAVLANSTLLQKPSSFHLSLPFFGEGISI
jgi:hypothetical protein